MWKWIRFKGLIAFLVVVAVVCLFWFVFVDVLIEGLIEKYGTKLVGARVELAEADLSLFPVGLGLRGLRVTNPHNPMRNAVEVEGTDFTLNTDQLLERKIIIKEMAINGVRLNTPRKRSEAISGKAKGPSGESRESTKGASRKIKLPSLEVPDVKKILEKEDLESVRLVESVKQDIRKTKEKWEKRLDELPGEKDIESYKKRLDRLKAKSESGLAGILSSAGELVSIKKDLEEDLSHIKRAREGFEKEKKKLISRFKEAQRAPLRDVQRLKAKYSLSPQGLANLGDLLLKSGLSDWVNRAFSWYQRLKPVIERAKRKRGGKEVVEPVREEGVYVRFREYAPLPDFLIQRARASVVIEAGTISGKIRNITPDQDVLGLPLSFEFSGRDMEGLDFVELSGLLDHIRPTHPEDRISFRIKGYKTRDVALTGTEEWPITLKQGLADLRAEIVLKGGNVAGDLVAGLKRVNLSSGLKGDSKDLADVINSALSGVKRFEIKARIKGTLEEYRMEITSDLERILQDAVTGVVRKQAQRLEKHLKKAVFERVGEPLNETETAIAGLKEFSRALTERLELGRKATGGVKLSF